MLLCTYSLYRIYKLNHTRFKLHITYLCLWELTALGTKDKKGHNHLIETHENWRYGHRGSKEVKLQR